MLSQPFSVLDKLAAIERPPTFYNWIPSNDPQDSLFIHMILGSVPTDFVRQHHIILSSSR